MRERDAQGKYLPKGGRISELDIWYLQMMAEGHTVKAAARMRNVSPNTVECQRTEIFRVLGARNAPHAVALALKYGIIKFPESTNADPL